MTAADLDCTNHSDTCAYCSSSHFQDNQAHPAMVEQSISSDTRNLLDALQNAMQIISRLFGELDKKEEAVTEKDEQMAKLRTELEKQRSGISFPNKEKDEEIEELRTELESLRLELTRLVKERADETAQLLHEIKSQRTELTQKEEAIAEYTRKNAELSSLIDAKNEVIGQLERQLHEQKEELSSLVQKKGDMIVNLQDQLAEKTILMNERSSVIATLQSQNQEIRDQFNEKYSTIEELKATTNDYSFTSEFYEEEAKLSDQRSNIDEDTDGFVDACDGISITSSADFEVIAKASEFGDLSSPAISEIPQSNDSTLFDINLDEFQTSAETEGQHFLLEHKMLINEIADLLILNLKIPLPNAQVAAKKEEITFPSHLIGSVVDQLIKNHPSLNVQDLMSSVIKAIQTVTMKSEDDNMVAFWLSNCFELLCVVQTIRNREVCEQPYSGEEEFEVKATSEIHDNLDSLLIEIYDGWAKKLKRRLSDMIVPAVIKHQGLSEYVCNQSWSSNVNMIEAQFTIDHLTNFLTNLTETMRYYYVEESIRRQLTTELLRVIGFSAFNSLLLKINFSTWKRGFQIKHNVRQLEKWCASHDTAEAIPHLQPLLHAAELLTLDKASPKDIQTILDSCYYLNPSQIKKLLSLYYAEGMDTLPSLEDVKIVVAKVPSNEESDVLLLECHQVPDFIKPRPQKLQQVKKLVPDGMNLPYISQVIAIV